MIEIVLVMTLPGSIAVVAAKEDSTETLETIVVSAKRLDQTVVRISSFETKYGLTDNVNEVLILQQGISRIPESGSMLLVNGSGPYDNRYFVSDVPVLPPSHFVTHTFADKSGTMITTIEEVQVLTLESAGRVPGAPNGSILIWPGIHRAEKNYQKGRPEVHLNYGTLDADLGVSWGAGKDALYQVSVKKSDDRTIESLGWPVGGLFSSADTSRAGTGSAPGWGSPMGYGDLTFTGETRHGTLFHRSHVWLAYDSYREFFSPWGIMAYCVEAPEEASPWRITVGGANQKHLEGKEYGPYRPRKRIERSVATVFAEKRGVPFGSYLLNLNARYLLLFWDGFQTPPYGTYIDIAADDTTTWTAPHKKETLAAEGNENSISLHVGMQRRMGRFAFGGDAAAEIVMGKKSYFSPEQLAFVSLSLERNRLRTTLSVGGMRPDIRGLPSADYRFESIRKYGTSFEWENRSFEWADLSVNAYLNYLRDYPRVSLAPWDLSFDPEEETDLFTRGLSVKIDGKVGRIVQFYLIGNLGKSQRVLEDGKVEAFEWDQPWALRPGLSFVLKDESVQLRLCGSFSGGVPYRDLVLNGQGIEFSSLSNRMPPYRRLDFQFELRQPVEKHRLLTRYDAYIRVQNFPELFDGFVGGRTNAWKNTREYMWDYTMHRRDLVLQQFRVALGVRLGVRL